MSFYDQASLQDILAQGQGGMGMAQAVQSIPPSPYNQMAQTDPGFVNRITQRMQSLIEPTMDPRSQQLPDQAYGRASSHERGNQGIPDDETSAWETATAILKTPFAVLNTVRDGLQDTLGFGGAQYRQAQRDNVEALQNLPQRQREALGIDRISGIQTPGMAAGETSGTAGAPSSLGSNAGSTMKGYVEWANNMGRDRAQQTMNQVRATINAQYAAGKMTKQELENLNEVLTGLRTNADTERIGAVTQGQYIDNAWKPRVYQAGISRDNAAAGDSNAGAALKYGQLRTVEDLRPGQVEEQWGKAGEATGKAQGEDLKNFYYDEGGKLDLEGKRQALDQSAKRFPYTIAGDVAKTNRDIIAGDVDRGAYPSGTHGVASGSQGVGTGGSGSGDAKARFEALATINDALSGKTGTDPLSMEDASQRFGIPYSNPWFGSEKLNFSNYDPLNPRGIPGLSNIDSGSSSSAPPSGRTAQQPTPLLPLPGVDPAPSSTSAVRPTGDAIYAITQILRKGDPAANAGDQVQYAEDLAKLLQSADLSSDVAFARSVVKSPTNPNGVPKEIARAYWKGLRAGQ